MPFPGHGPPYPRRPQLFFPCTPLGSCPAGMDWSDSLCAGILNKIQWSHVPVGESGSSTISASVFASWGTLAILSGGDISSPSQVKRDGMLAPLANSPLVMVMAGMFLRILGVMGFVNTIYAPARIATKAMPMSARPVFIYTVYNIIRMFKESP